MEKIKVLLGNMKLMSDADIKITELEEQAEAMSKGGQTVIFVMVDRQLAGILAGSDPIK